ncbi:MAG: small multi-drug export protein [Eubacteriales bacterium]|nr:small multi-drug export protein [Eubacteriales bacterium]
MKKYLFVFLVSMVPIVELRGAIPFSQVLGLPLIPSYVIAIIGNMIPVPFIYLFARKILVWLSDKPSVLGKIGNFFLEKGERGGKKLESAAGKRGLFFALLLFVGIPLPGTGAWTGTLAASILNMDFKTSVKAAMGGVILAGFIMSCGSKIVMLLAGLF